MVGAFPPWRSDALPCCSASCLQSLTWFRLWRLQDKSEPKDWYKAEGITVFPPESDLQGTAIDDFKKFFSQESISGMFS